MATNPNYDLMLDVPTLTASCNSNFATLNPLQVGSATTLTSANLNNDYSGAATDSMSFSTIAFDASSSNFYAEFTYVSSSLTASGVAAIGICDVTTVGTGNITTTGTAVVYVDDGTKRVNGTNSAYGAIWATGDVIGVQINSGTVTFYKNGTTQGSASTGLTGTYKFVIRGRSGTSRTFTIAANFGQQPFSYTPPSGFTCLDAYDLPTPTIAQGNTQMDATPYTGTGASNLVTNGGAFQPDLIWLKARNVSSGPINHVLMDSNRGAGKLLYSNLTQAEDDVGATWTTFNTNGFTLSAAAGQNQSGTTFAAWQWKGGGTSSSNTLGTISSAVSVNQTAGFSITSWSGNGSSVQVSVGHGLGAVPSFMIYRCRNLVSQWWVTHASLTGGTQTGFLQLNNTNAQNTSPLVWGNKSADANLFYTINGYIGDANSQQILYAWTPIAGYSAFGSYIGNGSADGPFIYTGFRPKFLLFKRSDVGGGYQDWILLDSARSTTNPVSFPNQLVPNSNVQEGRQSDGGIPAGPMLDFYSNGFKLRDTTSYVNTSGSTYIYAAFAENPLKYSLAR